MVLTENNKYFLLLFFIFPVTAPAFDHGHSGYDQLLKEVVITRGAQSDVDYALLKVQQGRLDNYLASLEAVTGQEFQSWNNHQQLAFLINTYNAFTLKLIIINYPGISSIRDLGGLVFSTPWEKKFFTLFGRETSLDYLEHKIIRKDFDEPRIHFAVNCASRGCPPLQPAAYKAEKLDQQLEQVTRQFLTDQDRNRYDRDRKILEISSIFKWYKPDFEKASGTVENFIAPYITDDPEIRTLIENRVARIRYLEYDWSLNDKK